MKQLLNSLGIVLALLLIGGCSGGSEVRIAEKPFDKLSEYNFYVGNLVDLQPNARVLPYDLNSTLFTDYAEKARFVWMPEGTTAQYTEEGVLEFPLQTVLIKNFYYNKDDRDPSKGKRIIETRLLIKDGEEWAAHPYVWNDEQTEATLEVVGAIKAVTWTDGEGQERDFEYLVPNKNQCKACHYNKGVQKPIGPKVRNLNKDFLYPEGRMNQLEKWASVGYLKGYNPQVAHPAVAQWDKPETGSLHSRALAYMDINCGHCHNPNGPASTTGLNLVYDAPMDATLGIMKESVAAGRGTGGRDYNILPGNPSRSILMFRMASSDPAVMMPEIGRRLVHKEGVALIHDWIAEMEK